MSALQYCPICGQDEAVSKVAGNANQGTRYVCSAKHGGSGPHTFAPVVPATLTSKSPHAASTSADAKTDDLLAPLEAVMRELPPVWVEHGVIEDRLLNRDPELWARHVSEAGHIVFSKGTGQRTASGSRFSMALQRLGRAGIIVNEGRQPSGAWGHDSVVSFWALTPPPAADKTLTWAGYRTAAGLPIDDWTVEERSRMATLVAEATGSKAYVPADDA